MSLSQQPKKRFVGNAVPLSLRTDSALNELVARLPNNYNFEIYKIIHLIQSGKYSYVALQFPEGLLMYSLVIADILEEYCSVGTLVMGDVTYGACCIDDYTARGFIS